MITPTEDPILAALQTEAMTYVELVAATGLTMTPLRRRVRVLLQAGTVQIIGKRKATNGLMADLIGLDDKPRAIPAAAFVFHQPRPWNPPRFKSVFAGGINPWHIYAEQT